VPPQTAVILKSDPGTIRVFGVGDKHSGEPGYASEHVDFEAVRDPLDWSLPVVWHLNASRGNTPMVSRRTVLFSETARHRVRHDLESDTHVVTGPRGVQGVTGMRKRRIGSAVIYDNSTALPRARLVGKPVYVANETEAAGAVERLGDALREQVVVEDPGRPLAVDAEISGAALLIEDLPERVVVESESAGPAYLVLADTFDPGWSAVVDGRSTPIWPAYIAFRAVYLPKGTHKVVFTYSPAGFQLGLFLSACGVLLGVILWFRSPWSGFLVPEHATLYWPRRWRTWWFLSLGAIVVISAVGFTPSGLPRLHSRWKNGVHRHTWGAGVAAMKPNRL
jgi:hypothetical protein